MPSVSTTVTVASPAIGWPLLPPPEHAAMVIARVDPARMASGARLTSAPRRVRAALVLDVGVELVPIFLQVRDDGESRAVRERADRLAHHLIADAQQQIHFVDLGVALLDAAAD